MERLDSDATEELAVHITHVLPAPRTVVFRAFTQPGELKKWWGPRGFEIPEVELELRAGGSYRIEMQPPEGDAFYLSGEFLEVMSPSRLSYTFRWEEPDPDDQENVVILSLRDVADESTEVTLDQRPFATEPRRALHEQGWTDGFAKLHELCQATGA